MSLANYNNVEHEQQVLNEDIEMMETDDNGANNVHHNHNHNHNDNDQHCGQNTIIHKLKRQYSDNKAALETSLSKMLDKNVRNCEIMERHIVKAKRKLSQQISNSGIGITCVLDTNILLSNLNQLKRLMVLHQNFTNNKPIVTSTKVSSFLVPWVVIQELDYQKTIGNNDSMRAISFINEQLRIKDSLIRGEKCANKSDAKIAEELNDDKIINCCLKQLSMSESAKVILISNDINLCNKALINDINAMNWCEFHQYFCSDNKKLISEQTTKNTEKFVSHCEQQLDEPKSKKLKKSAATPVPQSFSFTPRITFSSSNTFQAKSTPDKSPSVSLEVKHVKLLPKFSPKKRHKTKSSLSSTKFKEESVIKYKYKCEHKLIEFIREQYKSIWGETDWKKMLEINLDNATLRDMIRLMRKEWFNFSDYFNRDRFVKSLIDKLHTTLSQENMININDAELYKDLKRLITEIASYKSAKH